MSGQLPSARLCSPNARTPSMRSCWETCRAGCGSWPGVPPRASPLWGRLTAGSTAARPRNPGVGQLLAVGRRCEAAQARVSLCPGVGSTPACAVPAPAVPAGPHPSGSSRCGSSPLWWPPAQIFREPSRGASLDDRPAPEALGLSLVSQSCCRPWSSGCHCSMNNHSGDRI